MPKRERYKKTLNTDKISVGDYFIQKTPYGSEVVKIINETPTKFKLSNGLYLSKRTGKLVRHPSDKQNIIHERTSFKRITQEEAIEILHKKDKIQMAKEIMHKLRYLNYKEMLELYKKIKDRMEEERLGRMKKEMEYMNRE